MIGTFTLDSRGVPPVWRIADLGCILALAILSRIFFWPPTLVGMDSIGFAVGGLGTWCAHPPGYFGVCFGAWLINHVIGNIKDSLVLMNLTATMVGILAVYRLAQWAGLSRVWTILGTASYAFSINMLYNSVTPLSYATEAMFAALIGLLVFITARTKSQLWALIATLIWGFSGFFRQTSCFVLAPLVAWMVLFSVPWRLWLVHAALGLAICWSWMAVNSYYMSAAAGIRSTSSFAGSVWDTQIMMQSNYDTTSLQASSQVEAGTGSGFHWPGVELLAWVDDGLGTHLLPDWRKHSPLPPSPARALRLTLNQVGKVGYFLILSLPPLLLLLPGAWMALKKHSCSKILTRLRSSRTAWFLAIWIVPALTLFVFGHIGPPGYLLVFLPTWVLALALLCQFAESLPEHRNESGSQAGWLATAHAVLIAAGLGFFLMAGPFRSDNSRQQLADIIALQYTGKAISQGYNIARSQLAQPAQNRAPNWTKLVSDQELVEWWEKTNPDSPALFRPSAAPR